MTDNLTTPRLLEVDVKNVSIGREHCMALLDKNIQSILAASYRLIPWTQIQRQW
jgi:hypothetical protein